MQVDDRAVKRAVRRVPLAARVLRGLRDTASNLAAVQTIRQRVQPRSSVFAQIYQQNRWESEESRSGPGSTLYATTLVRRDLPALLERWGIRTMLDAPCGDWRWMRETPLPLDRYIGADIVAPMIEDHQRRFADEGHEFLVRDITRDALPTVDLVFCRDCLVHLSHDDVRAALRNFRDSRSTYLLTTTYPETTQNRNIFSGNWRDLNLTRPPFNLPPPLDAIEEGPYDLMDDGAPYRPDKMLGLWRLDDLPGL